MEVWKSEGVTATRHGSPQLSWGTRPGRRTRPRLPPFLGLARPPHFGPLPAPVLVPDRTWYLLVELKGISATLGFLSLIFLTEPQDSSMHLSRADSEASPAVSRCRRRIRGHLGRGRRAPKPPPHTPRLSEGVRGGAGRQQGGQVRRRPTFDTEMFSCPALKTARLQRPAIRDRAVHVGDRLSKVAPGRQGGRSGRAAQVPRLPPPRLAATRAPWTSSGPSPPRSAQSPD